MVMTVEETKVAKVPVGLWKALRHTPHAGQLPLYELSSAMLRHQEGAPKFLNATCSRRWGKTEAARVILWDAVLQPPDMFGPPYVAVISDTHEHASKIWDRVLKDLYTNDYFRALLVNHDRERERITIKSGGVFQRFSTDSPESVSGEGATCGIFDESQDVDDEGVTNFLPSLTERNGVAIAFGVAQNDGNWFDTWEDRGDDPEMPEYEHLAFPWYTNPFLSESMIKVFARDLTEDDFKRLYLATRPNKGETIWTNLNACIVSTIPLDPGMEPLIVEPPKDGHRYVAGLDIAKSNDYTVFMVADYHTGNLVYFHRLNQQEIRTQAAKIAKPMMMYAPHCLVDMTGIGQSAIEQFRSALDEAYQQEWERKGSLDWLNHRGSYEGITWNNQEKTDMVSKATVLMERERVRFPYIVPMVREFRKYRREKTPTGKLTYAAPSGSHDDCVSSFLMLCKLLPNTTASRLSLPKRHKGGYEYIK